MALDGALVRTDMRHEQLLLLLRRAPRALARLPGGNGNGAGIDPECLPYRAEVLALVRDARAQARPVVLVTATPSQDAAAVAAHLDLLGEAATRDGGPPCASPVAAGALVQRFGIGGFDYVGHRRADLPIFAQARRGVLASSNRRLRDKAIAAQPNMRFIDAGKAGPRTWAGALRLHQWLKNGLVFAPLLAAQEAGDLPTLLAACLAFASFCLCASSVYIVNDLLDLPSDRQHHTKNARPFASGALPIAAGLALFPVLLAASFAIGAFLPPLFLVALGTYVAITAVYSLWLKRQPSVDVMLLASLYTLRILAGAAATGIEPSFWLLAFSMFIFFCLAMAKRYSELRLAMMEGKSIAGRGYQASDLPVVLALGAGSGLVAVHILAMYTQTQIVPKQYPAEAWLWLVPPLMLYWIARLWMKAGRGEIDDDPVLFAAKDWQSLAVIVAMGAAFLLAASGWFPW